MIECIALLSIGLNIYLNRYQADWFNELSRLEDWDNEFMRIVHNDISDTGVIKIWFQLPTLIQLVKEGLLNKWQTQFENYLLHS